MTANSLFFVSRLGKARLIGLSPMDKSLTKAGTPCSVGHHNLVGSVAEPDLNGFSIQPNTHAARLKSLAGRLSLFDAVPFFLAP
jgi:hypothetical protein